MEDPVVISETRFAKRYNSLWRSLAPTMELFIRKCNLTLYSRNWKEIGSASPAGSRALVNRTAFELFCAGYDATKTLTTYLDFINSDDNVSSAEVAVAGINVLDSIERTDVYEIARRIWLHFSHSGKPELLLRPQFKGCGIINTCAGDIFKPPSRIVELKDGDRPFRSYEFRQLSVYAALYLNETGIVPSSIEVVNSRRGVYVAISLERFADEVAGQSAVDYLREVIRVITDESGSR